MEDQESQELCKKIVRAVGEALQNDPTFKNLLQDMESRGCKIELGVQINVYRIGQKAEEPAVAPETDEAFLRRLKIRFD